MAKIYKSKTIEITDDLGVYLPVAEESYEANAPMQAIGFTISGNCGVAGATISWSGTSSGSSVADGSGNYVTGSLTNGTYVVTPSLSGYAFSPTSSAQTIAGSSITGVNFTATLILFNVWQPRGQYISVMPGFVGNPSIIYDTNPQILTGQTNVFKLWVGLDSSGELYYYESLTAEPNSWTAYSGNPIDAPPNHASFPTVWKEGSTYYLYGNSGFPSQLYIYTSTDGINWTDTGAHIPLGAGGSFDANGIFQLQIVDIVNGTWYGYYLGYNSVSGYLPALVTSTDGIHWTKDPGNPIHLIAGGWQTGNLSFLKAGGQYYLYAAFYDSIPAGMPAANYRTGRWQSANPNGPWTRLMYQGQPVPTYYLTDPSELNSANSNLPQVGPNDQRMCVALGNIYMFYTFTAGGGNELGVNSTVAAGYTPEQLVATYEGVLNVPPTGLPQLNLTTLGSDNFQRANVNPIGGNWTPLTAGHTAQIASDLLNPSAITVPGDSYWNATSWPNNQWSKVTAHTQNFSDDYLGVDVRNSLAPSNTYYTLIPNGGFGPTSNLDIQRYFGGTFHEFQQYKIAFSQGDTVMLAAIGSNILSYWNDQLVWNQVDANIASGVAAFELYATAATTDSAISSWSGGGFQAAPAITFSISGHATAGALISYSGPSSGSVTADGSGNYTISGLAPGTYTITPSLAGYAFSPPSAVETYIGGNITGVNFTAKKSSGGSGLGFGFDFTYRR